MAVGGAAGSALRWALAEAGVGGSDRWAVLAANVAGSALLGWLAARASASSPVGPRLGLALGVGFCGGLTTFSAFAVDVAASLRTGDGSVAGLYSVLTVVGCLGAVAAGRRLGPS